MKNTLILISLSMLALASSASAGNDKYLDTGIAKPLQTGSERRVDNRVDTWLTAHSGPAGKSVAGSYEQDFSRLDTTVARQGFHAVRFEISNPEKQGAWGFFTGPYLSQWALAKEFTLHLQVMADKPTTEGGWQIVLYDTSGRRAATVLKGMAGDSQWHDFTLPLSDLAAEEGFDFAALRAVQVEAKLHKKTQLWLDNVHFRHGDEVLGVSDKTVTQYMTEAAATRSLRVEEFNKQSHNHPLLKYHARLYNGTDLEKVNQEIIDAATKGSSQKGFNLYREKEAWSLYAGSLVSHLYFGFSSKGLIKPGRLTKECEKVLLDYYWEHTKYLNDIATARHSSWWVMNSENIDISVKVANLLSSQIFKEDPNYADRIYPDLGRMLAYNGDNRSVIKVPAKGKGPSFHLGSGNYKDGKEYRAAEHYTAWVTFWKEYIAERARHGFFVEHNAAGYMSHTHRFLCDLYAWNKDESLRQQMGMFFDLIWAQWAQDQTLGFTSGPVTRGGIGWTRMGRMAEFLLGGPVGIGEMYAFTDYELPRVVWEMILGRPAMGEYAYLSRKPNEAQNIWPRPAGTEMTLLVNPQSRLARYIWATPDYVMGVRQDHPDALYHHLSMSAEGILFPTSPDASVTWAWGKSAYRQSIQDRSVALIQPKRSVRMRQPEWFPAIETTSGAKNPAVVFGKDIDRIEEKEGWIFAQEGKAYVAVRFVTPDTEPGIERLGHAQFYKKPKKIDVDGFGLFEPLLQSYTWDEQKQNKKGKTPRKATAVDLYSPLIVEASRQAHHPTLEAFQKDILDNPLHLKQLINGFSLTYRGCDNEAQELSLNCASLATPKVGGKHVNYNCPTFDSPWLKGDFGSGVVTLTGPISGEKLVLDFNRIKRAKKQTVAKASADTAMPLMEKFAYKPSYSREELKTLMGDLLELKITDADFFGSYKNSRWVKAPMLDYKYNNSAMSKVEEAAKAGNYKKAADALLAYFKTREPKPLKRRPDCGVTKLEGKTVDFLEGNKIDAYGHDNKGNQAQAAMALTRIYLPNAAKVFKRKDCTPKECVEYLKGVSKMGMIWSNGYCPNTSINGLGGNWIPWHSHDAAVSLDALPELSDGKRWIAKSYEYLNTNLKYIMLDDGSYIEHTFGYPRKVLPLMMNLRDLFLEHGLPVSDRFGFQTHRMGRYLMFSSLPNGLGIEWGEGHMGNSRQMVARAAHYFNDPELDWWASYGERGHAPKVKDVHFPESKTCIFRSSWNEDANFLFFAPRTGGSHYHADQNMIELYAYGQRFLRDTGMCSYSSKDPAFDFLRHQNRSHNTIEVDGKGFPRFERTGEDRTQDDLCESKMYSSSKAGFAQGWGAGYPTVRHERDVFFVRDTGMTVVLDILKPKDDKVHTYDQCWHLDPSNTYKSDAKTCKVWTTNKEAPNLDMFPVHPKGLKLLLRDGWNMQPRTETVYPSFRQKTAGNAEFLTLIRPTPQGASSRELKAEKINTGKKDVRAIKITTAEGTAILAFSRVKGVVTVEHVETDAECAFVQFDKNGKVKWAVRKGGSTLTVKGEKIQSELMKSVSYPAVPSKRDLDKYAESLKELDKRKEEFNATTAAALKARDAKNFKSAAQEYEKALQLATDDMDRSKILYAKGLCYHWSGKHKEATETFSKLVAMKRADKYTQTLGWRQLGMNYMALKENAKAKEAFEIFLKRPGAPYRKSVEEALEKIKIENKNSTVL